MSEGAESGRGRVIRTVEEHVAEVARLLQPLGTRLSGDAGAERLMVVAEQMARHPDLYADRVLAVDVVAPIDLPPFDNSQMDGYAVRSADVMDASPTAPVALDVAPHIPAGHAAPPLAARHAAPIMTGAPIPAGADAVVPIERVDPAHFLPDVGEGDVRFAEPVAPGTFVRARGSDIAAGQVLLRAGTRLSAAHWGVLAASGVASVPVRRRVRVTILSTGEELRQPGEELGAGQIFDANSVALTRAVAEAGAEVRRVDAVTDDPARFAAQLDALGRDTDILLTTGGVSAGAYEVVRESLAGAGVSFVGVRMQPGGPQGLGMLGPTGPVVITFPGNPVSALVSFEVFLQPVLRALAGSESSRPRMRVALAEPASSPPDKHQVRRGRLRDDGRVDLVGGPGSHLLHAYAASELLVHIPVGVASVTTDDTLDAWRIHD